MVEFNILVTGGAGYIGSHTVLELLNAGYGVFVIDSFINSISVDGKNEMAVSLQRVSSIAGKPVRFERCDLLEEEQLDKLFAENKFDAVIHFAALKSVGESVAKPLDYYNNNIVGSLNLIERCRKHGVKHFVFSSSATVYGAPEEFPIKEKATTGLHLTNPYGQSKYMIEQILIDISKAEPDWHICILRYFNPVGAHPSGLIGEDPRGIPNNLMPYIAQVASGRLPVLAIYGDKYNTPDGTGVRDYIHIMDLARAHVCALDKILKAGRQEEERVEIYNLGTGKGYSVKEMVAAFEKACGKKINARISDPRPGDLPTTYCDPTLAEEKLGWKAKLGIDEMCRDMWNWTEKNPKGYSEQ